MKRPLLHTFTIISVGLVALHAAFGLVIARLDIPYPSFQVARSVELSWNELQRLAARHNAEYQQAFMECQVALDRYWELQVEHSQVLDLQANPMEIPRAKRALLKKAEKLYKETRIMLKRTEKFKDAVEKLP